MPAPVNTPGPHHFSASNQRSFCSQFTNLNNNCRKMHNRPANDARSCHFQALDLLQTSYAHKSKKLCWNFSTDFMEAVWLQEYLQVSPSIPKCSASWTLPMPISQLELRHQRSSTKSWQLLLISWKAWQMIWSNSW